MQTAALDGCRVIELGTMLAGPFGAHILAELGADVIKVEAPTGDPTRTLVRGGPSGTFIAYSHGKRSVAIDLTMPDGHAALLKLLATADVVIHNLAPGAARRLRVTYEQCLAVNPGIVYCHIRGFAAGPLEDDLASNPVAEAMTGVMEANRVNGRPSRLGPSYHDQFAGAYAVIRILAALMHGEAKPELRKIEIGLYETGLHVAARDLAGLQLKTHLYGKAERELGGEFAMPGYGAFETADHRWAYLLLLNDGHWLKFCQALALPEASDSTLATLRQRRKQRERVEGVVKSAALSITFDELAVRLRSVGIGFTEIIPLEKVLDAPHARQPGKLKQLEYRTFAFDVPTFPIASNLAETKAKLPPPEMGQHTLEVLRSIGMSEEECQKLMDAGAVSIARPDDFAWAPVRNVREQ